MTHWEINFLIISNISLLEVYFVFWWIPLSFLVVQVSGDDLSLKSSCYPPWRINFWLESFYFFQYCRGITPFPLDLHYFLRSQSSFVSPILFVILFWSLLVFKAFLLLKKMVKENKLGDTNIYCVMKQNDSFQRTAK